MPLLHVPTPLRNLTDGVDRFTLEGATLREVLANLQRECPALYDRIVTDGDVRPDMAMAIDGSILEGGEMMQSVGADTEIYLVPPIGGG